MPRHEGQTRSTRSRNHRAMRSGKKNHQTQPRRTRNGPAVAPLDARIAGRRATAHADALTERFLSKG